MLTSIQIVLISVQLFLLFCTPEWHTTLSLGFLIFSNFYTLFKLLRDYLITYKVYEAETDIYNTQINSNT